MSQDLRPVLCFATHHTQALRDGFYLLIGVQCFRMEMSERLQPAKYIWQQLKLGINSMQSGIYPVYFLTGAGVYVLGYLPKLCESSFDQFRVGA